MQKFFFGEIVIPFILFWSFLFFDKLSPTRLYVNLFQHSCTILLFTLYEKHPPDLFFGSSHKGVIPFLITNNIQFLTNLPGNASVTEIVLSNSV